MAKILRLHGTGSSTTEGWSRTGKIGKNEIDGNNGIPDPAGALAERVVVAIPSPFARMHLVETALGYLATAGNSGGTDTVHHRLVGQFWDLWELVFNYYQQRQPGRRLLVRTWNRATELANLTNSPAKPLAQALTLFLNDKRFASLSDLHLFYFPGATPTEAPQLLGGTSPLTMFFPAPAVRALPVMRPEGGGHYFDGRYVALAQREREFQEYIYQQFIADPELRRLAPAVYGALDQGQLSLLGLQGDANINQYLPLPDHAGNPVGMAGVPVRVRPDQNTVRTSDFTVQATRPAAPGWPLQNPLPLVLRPGLQMPGKLYYNNSQFGDSGSKVPVTDARALPDRTLPGPDLAYPYLTLNDLLEETLLTVPYEVDGSRFVTGQLKIAPGYKPTCWPLLPVTPLYFEYFTAEDLARHLTLELDPACVRVRLSIPVSGGFTVDYERAYYENPRTEGLGRLLTTNVGLSIFPFVKIEDAPELNDFYKVMLVDANNIDPALVNKPVELRFGVKGRVLSETGTEQSATAYRRTPKTTSNEGSTYYEIKGTPFDYVQLASPAPAAGQALLVPKWRTVRQGTKEFRFAIDFGTTNTHVAYHDGPSQPPQPLSFGPDDTPVALLKKPSDSYEYSVYDQLYMGIEQDDAHGIGLKRWQRYQQREFVPSFVGAAGSPYKFPIRTATSESAGFTIEPPRLLANINVGFGINTEDDNNESYHTNLKWGTTGEAARHRVRMFFREMLLLFKYKAALHGGNIAATQVVWFAPLSFSQFSRDLYQLEWDRLFREIFHTSRATIYLPESSAPYFFLTRRGLVTPGVGENAAFIDIGGGTSDVLFYSDQNVNAAGPRKHHPAFSTSFRFAGNELWGDGAADVRGGRENGLVRFGLDSIGNNPMPQTKAAALALRCLSVVQKNPTFGSEEVASLLFNYEPEFEFGRRLVEAQHLRVLFYLHFGAIIYHLAQLTAARDLAAPRYLCFTGRGSLYLRLLCPSNLRPLEQVASLILAKVMGVPAPANFKIVLADDPKQTTANGGVLATGLDAESTAEVPPIVQPIGTGAADSTENQPLFPSNITEEIKNSVLANVEQCLTLLLTDPDLVATQHNLGIKNPPGLVLSEMKSALADSFNMGRQRYANTLPAGEPIPETLFFLPLKNALYVLSQKLYDSPK
ncbi:hypothetical protein D0N36_04360 [Hymenobacter lapidiphilus]|uniref:hypothetical protein n=1 Tax=Hymenobacter sp. CCM 8763 TaxID=2303334 RepID=UPI000E34906C|nr:hypothetical protein [Hymenobacter sp. CCM 8763]RFP66257.1 hypothetical protein D0N36_04360 [Hymenobacter sp. CCM 8763]